MGSHLVCSATLSEGFPKKNLGTILGPRLQLIAVLAETRLVSTATSQAEFPPPITKTRLSAKGAAFLKLWEWINSPSKFPGYSGNRGFQW